MQINLVLKGYINGTQGQDICVWIQDNPIKCIHIECSDVEEALRLQYKHIRITINQDKLQLVTGVFKMCSNDVISSSVIS